MQLTAYREVQRRWFWEIAQHIFSPSAVSSCHQGSTASHGSPDHYPHCPFRIGPFCMLGSSGFQPSASFVKTIASKAARSTRAQLRHLAGSRKIAEMWEARGWARTKWSRLKLFSQKVNCSLDHLPKPVNHTSASAGTTGKWGNTFLAGNLRHS